MGSQAQARPSVDGPAGSAGSEVGEGIPPWARWFVWAFFAVFVACAVGGLNLWPFSGWRLFSQVRTEHVRGWAAEGIDAAGHASPLPFGAMPRAYASFGLLMRDFPSLPAPRQVAMCRAWIEGARRAGTQVVRLRLVRVERDVLPRAGPGPATYRTRTPTYECGVGWIRTIGGRGAAG